MKLPRIRTIAIFAGIAVLMGIAAVELGQYLGAQASEEAKARMTVLWPSVFALSSEDRLVVVKAAMTCRVHRLAVGANATEVAACLRAGAREHDDQVGEGAVPISRRLDALLVDAQRAH